MNLICLAQQTSTRALKEPNCLSVSFHTSELNDDQILALTKNVNNTVTLFITDENIDIDKAKEEILKTIIRPDEKWTPSQRLRFEIVDSAKYNGLTSRENIDDFYRNRMEHYIALEKAERL